ncbi:excinuclease ABC subunit UvrA, partial [Patescibacteria group bacterium]|nr:excinuclease ABC subunit UvrA [Patescibacteria group bacterium]
HLMREGKLSASERTIALPILKEIAERLKFLVNVGLDYLSLDRSATSLAGGEMQRIRLATQIGSGLSGVIYILDEPSIGLHQRDQSKLITALKHLRDLRNTVVVVEHDEQTIRESDWVVDVGPGAGVNGGTITFSGTPQALLKSATLTGEYLSGKKKISSLDFAFSQTDLHAGKKLSIKNAYGHNLKNVNADIPLGKFVTVCGVSGSGKSSLILDTLSPALLKQFYQAKENPLPYDAIKGTEYVDRVIVVDQSPIGRTPRSNPATYTGVFTYIRDLFSSLPESKARGYTAGRFSFNVKGGRCEVCQGDGVKKIEMFFLPDVYVECEECRGERYNKDVLSIEYKGKNIAQVLKMSVVEAKEFFANIPPLYEKLKVLDEVGLGYIQLGQSATTLSGGEAQRIKLSTELSRRATGKTVYILDEPTTGLHFDDIKKLLMLLHQLVEKGNSIIVIEHNLDVIATSQWLIEMGPEGGEKGGQLLFSGTPEELARRKSSPTGAFLKQII